MTESELDFEFDPAHMLAVLEDDRVQYVVIGGLAAVLHGSPVLTQDLDVCPSREPENLERLARSLGKLGAKIRTETSPEGLPFACDAVFLRNVQLLMSNVTIGAAHDTRPTS